MRKFAVGIHLNVPPVIVDADEAVWDTTLKFMIGDRKVAVFFSPLWFKEVDPCECVEVDAGGSVAFDRTNCKVHPYTDSIS
jgi:hypothetical protein